MCVVRGRRESEVCGQGAHRTSMARPLLYQYTRTTPSGGGVVCVAPSGMRAQEEVDEGVWSELKRHRRALPTLLLLEMLLSLMY